MTIINRDASALSRSGQFDFVPSFLQRNFMSQEHSSIPYCTNPMRNSANHANRPVESERFKIRLGYIDVVNQRAIDTISAKEFRTAP